MSPEEIDPSSLRSVNPRAWPQMPFGSEDPPAKREASEPRYEIRADLDVRVKMRDGIELALDVFRPSVVGAHRFPALVGFGPYTRQLQQTNVPLPQNEGGIKEFWVPRGYAMVFVDVRGTNDSQGSWQMYGPDERQDFREIIEWVAAQTWCNGSVGMTGASYYGRTQLMAAQEQPPSLKAIFAYDAATDGYRDAFYHGGIPNEGMHRTWLSTVSVLNGWGGRTQDADAFRRLSRDILGGEYAYDGDFWWNRSAWPWLHEIDVPVYFGCHWSLFNLHLRGAFEGWMGTADIPKRMLISPTPQPRRPVAEFHQEMLRWYDAWLKDLDTGVMDGDPIRLWVQGIDAWRGASDWPLPETEWTSLYLQGARSGDIGTLSYTVPPEGGTTYAYRPSSPEWLWGRPRLEYVTAPFEDATEITGPVQLDVWLSTTAGDTDLLVALYADGGHHQRLLTRGWLRASHRAVDESRSRENRPWHPHTETAVKSMEPGRAELLQVEIMPTSYAFERGERLRLTIASSDSLPENQAWYHRSLLEPADNTVHEGGEYPSCLRLPVVPAS